jgi:hypothetical protein
MNSSKKEWKKSKRSLMESKMPSLKNFWTALTYKCREFTTIIVKIANKRVTELGLAPSRPRATPQ